MTTELWVLLPLLPTGSDISDFIHNLESQNIQVEMMRQSDYMSAAPHSAAINVTGSNKVTAHKEYYIFKALFMRCGSTSTCSSSGKSCWVLQLRVFYSLLFALCAQGFRYSVAFNSTTVHSLPMAVNILSNSLLRGLNGSGQIRTWTKPFDYVSIWQEKESHKTYLEHPFLTSNL